MFTLMDRVSQDAIYHSSVQKNHKILIVRYLKRIKDSFDVIPDLRLSFSHRLPSDGSVWRKIVDVPP